MKLALLALLVILGDIKAEGECDPYFQIWKADEEERDIRVNGWGEEVTLSCPEWKFNIEVLPLGYCFDFITPGSARLTWSKVNQDGETQTITTRTEKLQPFMVFGDQPRKDYVYSKDGEYQGNINGRDWRNGKYEIKATFYDKEGDEIATGEATINVVDCD